MTTGRLNMKSSTDWPLRSYNPATDDLFAIRSGTSPITVDGTSLVPGNGTITPQKLSPTLFADLSTADAVASYDTLVPVAEEGGDNRARTLESLLSAAGQLTVASIIAATSRPDGFAATTTSLSITQAADSDGGPGVVYWRVDAEPASGPKFRTADRYTSVGATDSLNGGWWAVVPSSRLLFRAYATAAARPLYERYTDVVSVADWLGNSTDDLGAAINSIMDDTSVKDGSLIKMPPRMDGATVTLATTANINRQVAVDFGNVRVNVASSLTGSSSSSIAGLAPALLLSAQYSRAWGGRWFGTRGLGQTFLKTTGFRSRFSCAQVELFDWLWVVDGDPYRPVFEDVMARNMRTGVVWLENCVGAAVNLVSHDIDGSWYGGSYPYATYSALIRAEGNQFSQCDFIHTGTFTLEAVHRHVYWNMFTDSYLSDSNYDGVGMELKNSSSYRLDGNFATGCWLATNNVGLKTSGTSFINGMYWNGGSVHNNMQRALSIENSQSYNIEFNGTVFAGNSASGVGLYPTVYTNTAGEVRLRNCSFGRQMGWGSRPSYEIVTGSSQSGDVLLNGSAFDAGAWVSGPISKGGSGYVYLDGVQGLVRKARGFASISSGSTSVTVSPSLSVPFSDENVLFTPATGIWGWHDDAGPSTFKIVIPNTVGYAAQFAWMVEVDRL